MKKLLAFAFLGVACTAIGCGDGLSRVPIEGTLKVKGKPIDSAVIVFSPVGDTKGEGAIGGTDAQGKFKVVGSRKGDEGMVAGKYKVRINRVLDRDGTVLPPDAKQADYPHAVETIPHPYSSPESPLEVTIPESGGAVAIELPMGVELKAGPQKK